MQLSRLSLVFICLLAFTLVFQTSVKSDLPLSWDVWYHVRISRQFSQGEFTWDSGSFGPEGRPHSYPPLFHVLTALFYRTTHIPLETLARVLPSFIFTASIYTLYMLVKEISTEKAALITCVFASVSPIILDRSMSYTPEALSFIFFNLGLLSFWKGSSIRSGICGGLLLLTHGLSSVAFFSVLLTYTVVSFFVRKENMWKRFLQALILAGAIASFWLLQSVPLHIPYGGVEPVRMYPQKLGWVQLICAFLGLTRLSKDRKSIFILSCTGSLFLLSQNPVSLPSRFIEFLAFPVCILAAQAVSSLSHKKMTWLTLFFLLAFAQGYLYTEQYTPVPTAEETTAYRWLSRNSVDGSTIMTEWKTAPVLAFFSERAPVKGAYQFGAPTLAERNEDTLLFYTDYPDYLLSKYEISYVYYGRWEQHHPEPPYPRVYSTSCTRFYHR
jgi:hypothetical protein